MKSVLARIAIHGDTVFRIKPRSAGCDRTTNRNGGLRFASNSPYQK